MSVDRSAILAEARRVVEAGAQPLLAEMRSALERGSVLVPVSRQTKRPVTAWRDRSPFTSEELEAYVRRGCGLALRTGSREGYADQPCGGGSAVVVIDVDAHAGGFRDPAWPETWTVLTPSGGLHLHYSWLGPDCIPSTASVLRPHVDVRARGGIALLPGSAHPRGIYRWAPDRGPADLPIAGLPAELVEHLRDRVPEVNVPKPPPCVGRWIGQGRFAAYATVALKRAIERITASSAGARNATLNREAFGIARIVAAGALLANEAEAALAAAAKGAGLSEAEIKSTIRSAFNAGAKRPVDLVLLEAKRRFSEKRRRSLR